MFLLDGSDTHSIVIESDDDGGSDRNSRITKSLSAGTYTIEATTYGSHRTGSFVLTLAGEDVTPPQERGYVLYVRGIAPLPGTEHTAQEWAEETFPVILRDLSSLRPYGQAYFSYRYRSGGGYGGPNARYTGQETRQPLATSAAALDQQIRGLINEWQESSPGTLPEIVIIAHSLGGAVTALWASEAREEELAAVRTVFTLDSPVAGSSYHWFDEADNDLRNQNVIDKMAHGATRLDFVQVGNFNDLIVRHDESFTSMPWAALSITCSGVNFSHSCVLHNERVLSVIELYLSKSPPLWSGGVVRPGPWGSELEQHFVTTRTDPGGIAVTGGGNY